MKKEIAIVIALFVLVFLWWIFGANNNSEYGSSELERVEIEKPIEQPITYQGGSYALDCKSIKYTSVQIGGILNEESYITISDGNEKQTLYVEGSTAKYFGADYIVVQDTNLYLIIMRTYPISGLTEVVTINKETGIGFNTKTLGMGPSGGPNSDTYIIACSQI